MSSSSSSTSGGTGPAPGASASSWYPSWALVVGSILTTVALVVVNKWVFQEGFPFVLALSTLHFLTTFLIMVGLSAAGAFERKSLPLRTNALVGAMGVASIAFMNYSLRFNSVGMYQMAKLCIIPAVLAQQILTKGEYVSRKVFASLVLVLLGVGCATVTDVTVNGVGLAFATAAVITTAQYQIWQGSKQREYGLSEMQMTMSVASAQLVVGTVLTLVIEGEDLYRKFGPKPDEDWASPAPAKAPAPPASEGMSRSHLAAWILLSCLLAVSANAHSFALIGRTSAVTWQVVGHGKTTMIILAGWLLFPLPPTDELVYNVAAVSTAVLGVILYSSVKLNENRGADSRDLFDQYAPAFLLNLLVPQRATHSALPQSIPDDDVEKPPPKP